jgi:hypothetical protein
VTPVIRILDTGALLSYAQQTSPHVAYQLSVCVDLNRMMSTSVLCLSEAYQTADADASDLLDVLVNLPTVEVVDCRAQDGVLVGAIAKKVGRLSLAHSCLLVFAEDVPLVTTDAHAAGTVLESSQIWALP